MKKWRPVAAAAAVNAVYHDLILGTGGVGGINVTLPAPAGNLGALVWVKKVDAGAGAVTVLPNAAETIDGAASFALAARFDEALLSCDGTNWHIVASNVLANFPTGWLAASAAGRARVADGFFDAATAALKFATGVLPSIALAFGVLADGAPLVIPTPGFVSNAILCVATDNAAGNSVGYWASAATTGAGIVQNCLPSTAASGAFGSIAHAGSGGTSSGYTAAVDGAGEITVTKTGGGGNLGFTDCLFVLLG